MDRETERNRGKRSRIRATARKEDIDLTPHEHERVLKRTY